MSAATVPWIILFAPLVAAALILFFGKYSKPLSAGLAIAAAVVCGVLSWWLFFQPGNPGPNQIPWIELAGFSIPIGMLVDPLSRTMLVVVNTIAPLVFIYSLGYMAHEEGYWRYFAGLALFLFSMLGIVLADNFVMMFIFWELVGASSYILIGHYYGKDSAADASKQAFLVNRIGDFGFMLGILMIWMATQTVVFGEIFSKTSLLESQPVYLTIACILIFCGTIGKSAQLPLHVWLPNSMEGPTPVSSLLHAATMVAAGVFMLARFFPVLEAAPDAREVIAWIGGLTCLAAGLMATQQNDIKRILAYSTISQLGYMVLGVGVADTPDVPMFHLFTHAFFKCLLFLCAGSVIVAMHHEQDIWKMGALKNKTPITFLCLIAGTLALTGFGFGPFGFSGFYSKDLIIEWAIVKAPVLGWIAVLTAGLTSFYMFRLFFVVFLGAPRTESAKKAHESPLVMILPLILLAIPAFAGGFPFVSRIFFQLEEPENVPHVVHFALLAMFLGGFALAWALYRRAEKDPLSIPLFANRLYIDPVYAWIVKTFQDGVGWLAGWADRWVVDLFVAQIPSKLVWACGYVLRFLQFGNIQAYAFFFGAGVIGVIYFLIAR
ncbi:MAG TPA: NADH-quinone oxidoreductase subunit L [Terrimicrobiaceae bacterium]|nr:NADH-quinone oxidoreductase subunit L [Terrimicrobiaceae bacterium]